MSQAPNTIFAPPDAQFGSPQPQRQGSNVLGIIGFVLSTLGLITCCIPFVGFIGSIGLVLSLIALFRAPRGFAIAGTMIGIIATIFAVLWLVLFSLMGAAIIASGGFMDFGKALMIVYQVDEQRARGGNYPADLTMLKEVPPEFRKDRNNIDFLYEVAPDGSTFTLKGAGPDATMGTTDDIEFTELFRKHNIQLQQSHTWPPPAPNAPTAPTDPNAPTTPDSPAETPDKGPV